MKNLNYLRFPYWFSAGRKWADRTVICPRCGITALLDANTPGSALLETHTRSRRSTPLYGMLNDGNGPSRYLSLPLCSGRRAILVHTFCIFHQHLWECVMKSFLIKYFPQAFMKKGENALDIVCWACSGMLRGKTFFLSIYSSHLLALYVLLSVLCSQRYYQLSSHTLDSFDDPETRVKECVKEKLENSNWRNVNLYTLKSVNMQSQILNHANPIVF